MESERKLFKFYRSYFDIYNELSKNDKLIFIDALLKKQFLGIDPVGLDGYAKFAYLSQKHSIEKQVKGFEDKTGYILHPPDTHPMQGGTVDPMQGGGLQEEVKEEVQEEVKVKGKKGDKNKNFELFWDHFHEHVKQPKSKKDPTLKHWNKLTLDDQRKAYSSVKNYANSKHPDEHEFLSIARTYLSDKLYNDEYGTTERLPDKEKILKRIKELENERS